MSIAPQVALSESFLTALANLPRAMQKKVREFTTKFRTNPTSAAINYESIHDVRDPKVRTVRIDLGHRAVIVHPPTGNVYLLVWVDKHDEAMDWARNKVFDVNATTGAIQVVDMVLASQAAEQAEARSSVVGSRGLFAPQSDDDLARTGLPPVLLPAVRAVTNEEQLDKLQPYLPQEVFEALFLVACGYDVDRAVRESSRPTTRPGDIDPTDFAAALDRPVSRRSFRLVGSDEELLEMLDASLDRWRVFLHPNQESIVQGRFKGPVRVLGGAGTGKTVVAMHRARHLARLYPDQRILFTAFNRNLAANIGDLLDGLCGPERQRIEVANVHKWAIGYAGRQWGNITIVKPEQERDCWDAVLQGGEGSPGWTRGDYEDEWRDVVQFHGVATLDEYLKVSRAGCAKPMKRAERARVWRGLAAFRAELARRSLMDWPDVIRKVRLDLEGKGVSPFRAVVVDEAQDIDAEQWRLIRALAPREDNSLFITGDAHQRIYGKPITLSQFGIDIRGRSHRLKINYRTTEQVLRWATRIIAGAEIDDLDGATDNTVGYRSLYTGPEPDVRECATDSEETAFLVERVRQLAAEAPAEEIAVLAKLKAQVRHYAEILSDAGVVCTVLDGETAGPGVRVATMHRVKGLDFTHVIMRMPHDEPSKDPRDQSLLYVAATRCRKTLTVLKGTG